MWAAAAGTIVRLDKSACGRPSGSIPAGVIGLHQPERGRYPAPSEKSCDYTAFHGSGTSRNLAVLQSLCSTCLLHGVNPYEYLKDVAVRVRTHPASRIDELLPWNWKPLDHLEAA